MTPYIFQRGETVSLALDCVSGDASGITAITADLKPVAAGRSGVDPGADVAASFDIAARDGGWTLTLSAADCVLLASGNYLSDARIAVGGGVIVTESVAIRIVEAVTAA